MDAIVMQLKTEDGKVHKEEIKNLKAINVYRRYGYEFVKAPTKEQMKAVLEASGKIEGKHFTEANLKKAFELATKDKNVK